MLFRNVVVLVNDFLIQQIKIQRGLKQGDPLKPFHFNLVDEGLIGLIRRAVKLSLFSRFQVGSSNFEITHV